MSQEEPTLPDDEDDKRLMALVAEGDDDALRLLVHRHHARLVGYLRGEVGSQATAEELAMEVFIRLHRAASRWRPEAKLSTYLIHIAHNLVLNEWRRRGRKPTTALEFAAEPGDSTQQSARRVAELDEAFQRAIAQLPPEQRTAIRALILHGIYSHDLSPEPLTIEAGITAVADGTDITKGRGRKAFQLGSIDIHSISALAVDEVRILKGEKVPVEIQVTMNNSAGIFQVEETLTKKVLKSPLRPYVTVVAMTDGEGGQDQRIVHRVRLHETEDRFVLD